MKPKKVSAPWVVGLALWGVSALSSAYAADALTLDDYFAAALLRSEVVATQVELIHQTQERYQQARGGLLPTVSGIGSYTWRERAGIDTTANPVPEPQARIAIKSL